MTRRVRAPKTFPTINRPIHPGLGRRFTCAHQMEITRPRLECLIVFRFVTEAFRFDVTACRVERLRLGDRGRRLRTEKCRILFRPRRNRLMSFLFQTNLRELPPCLGERLAFGDGVDNNPPSTPPTRTKPTREG
ncbi:hypothetical protein EVAR_55289_1 [Eumeta japonica]|uniref:Uncharacterized protein n=1 Tax=Eumeta variegata TaxID=151549 RepID=A0A4C1ZC55_EUMVA|nr:hypothetical protein EVAR_55289_1 [Eumeta japonica]